ncbi:MAG: fumarate hydratase, partial [Rhodospirillaceae bacterium]
MLDAAFAEIFPLGHDDGITYRKLDLGGVSIENFRGQDIVVIEPAVLTRLTADAFRDISHLLRPSHLAQLRVIIDDPEASPNDRFVALELIKNANIAAGGVLPMCQDTGTAIIMGKKGQNVWVDGDDSVAL